MDSTPRRLQMKRTAGWRKPVGAVYVGRTAAGAGEWGNPWRVTSFAPPGEPEGWYVVRDAEERGGEAEIERPFGWYGGPFDEREEAQAAAVEGFRGLIKARPGYADRARLALRGKDLLCWCKPGTPCHADILLELANTPLRCEAVNG